jgi:HK97 family phage major capsid protein
MTATTFRSADFETRAADKAARTVPVVLSTETPVDRGGYVEVLDHAPDSVDLVRAPLPLIESHDQGRLPIGVVENLRVEGRKLRGTVRFGSSARALEVFQDVLDGVVRGVSIGYELLREIGRDGATVRFAFRPLEASAVAIPADVNAGFYRSKDYPMQVTENAGTPGQARPRVDSHAQRVDDIHSIARKFNVAEPLVRTAIDDNWSASRFGGTVLEQLADRRDAPVAGGSRESLGMSQREVKDYSLLRAIRAVVEGNERLAPMEMEASRAVAQSYGRQARSSGFFVPLDVAQRDLTVASSTQGAKLVGTDHMAGDFIELLRRRMLMTELGARRLPGLRGHASIPKQTGPGTAYWLANEATSITESNPTIGQVLLTPKNVGAYCEISKQLMLQSAPGADMIVMEDLAAVVARAVDDAIINGTGADGQPTSILETVGIASFSVATATWAKLLEAQVDLSNSSALVPGCAYLTTGAVALALSARQRFSGTDSPLWEGSIADGRIAGFRAVSSSTMPANNILFGDFSQVIIGEWGGLEVEVNPYANFAAGIIGVRAWYSTDIGVRQAGAFSLATDFS